MNDRSTTFYLIVSVSLAGVGYLIRHTEQLRYDIALKRIGLEREQAQEAQLTERLRIEKATSLASAQSLASTFALGAGGAAGFALLRELISKGVPTAGSGGQGERRSTTAISGMVDALVSAGQIATGEAKSLKDDLQKAGIEIGVDAAKALIDRYI